MWLVSPQVAFAFKQVPTLWCLLKIVVKLELERAIKLITQAVLRLVQTLKEDLMTVLQN